MSDDVERVRKALAGCVVASGSFDDIARGVLAAIRAGPNLDAALAALTDHPGGTPE